MKRINAPQRVVAGLLAVGVIVASGAIALPAAATAEIDATEQVVEISQDDAEAAATPVGNNAETGEQSSPEKTGGSKSEQKHESLVAPQRLMMNAPALANEIGAIQDLAMCTANSIPRNDDESSLAVPIGFPVNFFGETHSTLYVNNNGNVTFNGPVEDYTPFDLTGDTGIPMIAPFFADIDTRNQDSKQVTYGTDGKTFCVNWVDVGFYPARADLRISAQLLIADRSAETGNPSDISITFNYGGVHWETGDASYGENGLGGDSAAVGYTAGTGSQGTFTQFAGSLVNGALLDGGRNSLSAGSRNSGVAGRYIFTFGGPEIVLEGSISGTVTDGTGPVAGVDVEICTLADICTETSTNVQDVYSVVGLSVGDYTVAIYPADVVDLWPAVKPAAVTSGTDTVVDFVLAPIEYSDLTINVVAFDGTPVAEAEVELCVDGYDCMTELVDELGVLELEDVPVAEATVTATPVPGSRLLPNSVEFAVKNTPTTVTVVLDPTIDRAVEVEVVDQDGKPISGAQVTIGTLDGTTFEALEAGSALLDADSANPAKTSAQGVAGWDVAEWDYQVNATANKCEAASATTDEFDDEGVAQVQITLKCADDLVVDVTDGKTKPVTGNLAKTGADLTLLGAGIALLGVGAVFTVARARQKSRA
ncbi:nidogen-like domain-containing protein [Jonesiaceae bacterium BS-20]|uniref:Nidogen-like domain-containing protein n=1 Tax=Jonesiaceae bacterium BS-20 TaxID=3120821 RepID=A0AAU7DVZ5_9MICO